MIVAVLFGLMALIVVLSLARWYASADVKNLKRTLAWLGIGLLALAAGFLAVTGRMGAAFAALAGLAVWAGRIINLVQMGRQFGGVFGSGRAPPEPAMSEEEALRILGLARGATPEEIKAAHRRIIEQIHPDRGGSDYLAAKVNHAKDFLLKVQGRNQG
ncbi:MAG: DnaJ domain-containing protein [Rhodospirillaceae bacterium]|nr:DnaJ domain-containing protein [Rhodospirillaceae bacterium]